MKKSLVIIGASGHGKVIADIALKMSQWKEIVFMDNNLNISECLGFKIINYASEYALYKDGYDFFVAIGNHLIREKITMELEAMGAEIATLIHPSAVIGEKVSIGKGTAVMAGVVINCSTVIGKGCIINTHSSIDHDNTIGAFVHVSPGAHTAGGVTIENNTWIGIGSIISNNLKVTSNCILGAGAVAVNNLMESGTYVGIPARRIK